MSNKTIVLAADHAGFELKEEVKRSLLELNYEKIVVLSSFSKVFS